MPKFKNVSPLGALDLPLVGRVVAAGEVIEVTAAQTKHLSGQEGVWRPIKGRGSSGASAPVSGPDSAIEDGEDNTGEGEGE